uniref:WW domain-containing protein n=1 Tax=Branchiostoma floridae TaxID=7739 RepID=C3XWQ0_BRAFL|eukprot:XP_002611150.1 hypothetical protein BRAFLDRAFT_88451 [Branchiostoma floridae]
MSHRPVWGDVRGRSHRTDYLKWPCSGRQIDHTLSSIQPHVLASRQQCIMGSRWRGYDIYRDDNGPVETVNNRSYQIHPNPSALMSSTTADIHQSDRTNSNVPPNTLNLQSSLNDAMNAATRTTTGGKSRKKYATTDLSSMGIPAGLSEPTLNQTSVTTDDLHRLRAGSQSKRKDADSPKAPAVQNANQPAETSRETTGYSSKRKGFLDYYADLEKSANTKVAEAWEKQLPEENTRIARIEEKLKQPPPDSASLSEPPKPELGPVAKLALERCEQNRRTRVSSDIQHYKAPVTEDLYATSAKTKVEADRLERPRDLPERPRDLPVPRSISDEGYDGMFSSPEADHQPTPSVDEDDDDDDDDTEVEDETDNEVEDEDVELEGYERLHRPEVRDALPPLSLPPDTTGPRHHRPEVRDALPPLSLPPDTTGPRHHRPEVRDALPPLSLPPDTTGPRPESAQVAPPHTEAEDSGLGENQASPKLPPGWEKVTETEGISFYWHIPTGTTQWDPPPPPSGDELKPRTDRKDEDEQWDPPPPPSGDELKPRSDRKDEEEQVDKEPAASTPDQDSSLQEFQKATLTLASKTLRSESVRKPPEEEEETRTGGEKKCYAVRSLGWVEMAEEDLAPGRSSMAVNNCIRQLSYRKTDIRDTAGIWGEGKDMFMVLEGEDLKLLDPTDRKVLHVQPIPQIRVWGVGRDNGRDFAYVARDKVTHTHKCHVFRCDTPAKAIANALHEICTRDGQQSVLFDLSKRYIRDFAYVARDKVTHTHKCHVFRCDTPAKAIANALHEICTRAQMRTVRNIYDDLCDIYKVRPLCSYKCAKCSYRSLADLSQAGAAGYRSVQRSDARVTPGYRSVQRSDARIADSLTMMYVEVPFVQVMTEKRRMKEVAMAQQRQQAERIDTPKEPVDFPTPKNEAISSFQVLYVGSTPVAKPSGIKVLNEAIDYVSRKNEDDWIPATVDVAPSAVTVKSKETREQLTECRVRFLSFLGIGRNAKMFGYIHALSATKFEAHVFHCEPTAAALSKAVEGACQLRYQKVIDARPEILKSSKPQAPAENKRWSSVKSGFQNMLGLRRNSKTRQTPPPEDRQTQPSAE